MATLHDRLQEDHGSQFLTETFQRGLAHWNRVRLSPRHPNEDRDMFEREFRMLRLERAFLAHLRSDVITEASHVPQDADGFITLGSKV